MFIIAFINDARANSDYSVDNNIHFTGTIVATTCNVTPGKEEQTVPLGDFSVADFPTVGSVSAAKEIKIYLTGCTANIKDTLVWFEGDSDNDNPELLKLSDNGKGATGTLASGIGVAILKPDQSTPVSINNADSDPYPLIEGNNTLSFYLQYKSTKYPVTPGDATAVLYFDLQYQ